MYADDLICIAENTRKAAAIIDIVKQWANKMELKMNNNKSAVMFVD